MSIHIRAAESSTTGSLAAAWFGGFLIVAILFGGSSTARAADDDEESKSTAYGSLGARYAIWGEPTDNFTTRNSVNKTAEFSWSLRNKSFFRARLEEADKPAAKATQKVKRYGLDAMFENFAIGTEFGRIAGYSDTSAGVVYQDVGPYSGPYAQFGLYENSPGWRYGAMVVRLQRPKLWRFAEGSCATVSSHCYFTDRETKQELYLFALRAGTYWRGEPMRTGGWDLDANLHYGMGLSRTTPSQRAVAGAAAATGIALQAKTLNGLGYYIDGALGMAYRVKQRIVTGEFALGVYYREQGSVLDQGGSRGMEVWDTAGARDWGPYLRATFGF